MAFRILNKEGRALTMGQLDKEAAEFWGKKVDDNHYANPYPEIIVDENASFEERINAEMENARHSSINWYEVIGWNISEQGNYTSGWHNVVYTMMADSLGRCLLKNKKDGSTGLAEFVGDGNKIHLEDNVEEKIYATLKYFKPFVDLINHWHSKGYIPEKV